MSAVLSNEQFDIAFSEWERNRMYPQYYRKEQLMKTPSLEHIDALIRSQNRLEFENDVTHNPRLKKLLAADIRLHCEIREMLLKIIENPTLPFTPVEVPLPKFVLDAIENEPNGAF